MSGASKELDRDKLNRVIVKVLQKEQKFSTSKKTAEIEKVRILKQIIRKEVLELRNYGGGK